MTDEEIRRLHPNVSFGPNTFAELGWTEVVDVQSPVVLHDYRFLRQTAYGSINEQLDMLYWDHVNGTSNWADHIAAVKAAYPKVS
jgi:hypothetical protein